jgi:clan AA aspartic protease (TIGR02281 family)
MRTAVAIVLFAISAALPARAAEPCKIPLVAEIQVQYTGLLRVRASIRGEPIPMIVDTGTPVTSISKETAQKLGLELRPEKRFSLHGTGGELSVYTVTIPEFVIGDGRFPSLEANVIEGQRKDARQLNVGLLGEDVLRGFDLLFDTKAGHLRLYEKTACARVPPWTGEFVSVPLFVERFGRIRFEVKIDGRALNAELDSGANRSFLTLQGARKLGVTRDSQGVERAGDRMGADGRIRESHAYRFQSFELESETVRNPRLIISDVFADLYPQTYRGGQTTLQSEAAPDFYLGADWLRAHRVYVGRATEEMLFSYVGGPIFEK